MCRSDHVTNATAVLLVFYYYVLIVIPVISQATPTDDTTKKTLDLLSAVDQNTHETIKQTLSAYQNYAFAPIEEYYQPESYTAPVTMTLESTDNDKNTLLNDSDYNNTSYEIYEQQTSTSADNIQTTVLLEQNASKYVEQTVSNITTTINDNIDQMSSKHAKMLIPLYDTENKQLVPVYSQNQIEMEALQMKNMTLNYDDDDLEDGIDNETQTTVYPVDRLMILKQSLTIAPTKTTRKTQLTTAIKFSADEILRKFLEDSYIRSPLATLINTSPDCLQKSRRLWKAALRPNAAVDIVLVTYNSSGVGVTYSFKNTRTMEAGLDSIQESLSSESGGNAFYGIVRASELIPYDSAIFISTDRIPLDTNLAQYAAITLLKKRIRLYLIWFGPEVIDDNETQGQNIEGGILGEVALRSGGEILRITEDDSRQSGDLGLVIKHLT